MKPGLGHALLQRFKRRPAQLADFVPYMLTLDGRHETVLTRAGGLLRVARIESPDLETASLEELVGHNERLAVLWGSLTSGVSVTVDQWRFEAPRYLPPSDFGGAWAAQAVDASRRRLFEGGKDVFQNEAFLAVHQVPRQRDVFLRWLRGDPEPAVKGIVRGFEENSEKLMRELTLILRGVQPLASDALAGYLAAVVNMRVQERVQMPQGLLAPQLAASFWNTSPSLSIDGKYVATVELINWGAPTPDTLAPLHELPFGCRLVTTFHALDADEQRSEIAAARRSWKSKQKKLGAYLQEWWTKNPYAGRTEPEPDRALAELEALEGNLLDEAFGLAHCNLHVWDDTANGAREKAAFAATQMNGPGLIARIADVNSFLAPIGDMPGNVGQGARNERRPRIKVRTVVRMSALTGVSSGVKEDRRFGGSALLVGRTRRGVPFWWSMNAPGSEDAHTVVVGKSGSGKSALLSLMKMQFLRYPGARVVFVDRFGSSMVPILALGGEWIELGDGGTGVQPLRAVDRPEEFTWAHGWVCRALSLRGVTITASVAGDVTDAMRHVAECRDADERTLSRLGSYLSGSEEARQALAYWCKGGPFGRGFDGVVRGHGSAPVIGVETNRVAGLGDAEPMMLLAFFRALQRDVLTGLQPAALFLDEAWAYLQSPVFAPQVESWARELRKRKTALVLATQHPSDLNTDVGRIVKAQAGNHIWCPHPEALKPELKRDFMDAGLSEEQVRGVAMAQPQAEYLIQSQVADRWVSLRLSEEALSLCGAGVGVAHERARWLLATGVEPGEGFARAWLAESTAEWSAAREAERLEMAA